MQPQAEEPSTASQLNRLLSVSVADADTPRFCMHTSHTLLLGTSGNIRKFFVHIEFTEVRYLDAHRHNSSPAEVGE